MRFYLNRIFWQIFLQLLAIHSVMDLTAKQQFHLTSMKQQASANHPNLKQKILDHFFKKKTIFLDFCLFFKFFKLF